MRRLAQAVMPTLRYWMQTEVHVYAFSVAANVLLSFFPFLIVMMSVSRLFFSERAVVGAITLALQDYFPDSLTQFVTRNLPQRQGSIQLVSILLLLFTANGIFEPLEVALNHVWGIRKNRSFVHNQIVSLGLIFVCGGLAILSLMLAELNQDSFSADGLPPGWFQNFVGGGMRLFSAMFFKAAAIPLTVLVLFLIYRYLPNGRPPMKRVLPAAIIIGILMEALKYLTSLVWPGFQQKLAREYGVFQYSVTLILLGFLSSMLILAGAEWAARGNRFDQTGDEEAVLEQSGHA
ncbi:MAG: YihY/virulence factor BrkB family protein [Bryobacteraceae bacterium]